MAAKSDAADGPAWKGDVWIPDEWTEEDRSAALNRLDASSSRSQDEQQSAFDEFRRNASTNWNVFYNHNKTNFFKDRHYLHKSFPAEFGWLYPDDVAEVDADGASSADICNAGEVTIVEIGCGVGNAIMPLLEQHSELMQQHQQQSSPVHAPPQLHIHCLDFAPTAIELLKEDPRFAAAAKEGRATAHVYDLSSMHPSTISVGNAQTLANSADVAILLFCLSAIGPHPSASLDRAARHVIDMLRPGGTLVIRDYGRLDEAQMKLGKGDKELGDNFYRKGDGTGCYYFELDDLRDLFVNKEEGDGKLELLELDYLQRVYRNRGDGTERRRVWVQGRFRKPHVEAIRDSTIPRRGSPQTLEQFLATNVERWDAHYRDLPTTRQSSSLPSNILQMFPNEFAPWQPAKGKRKPQPQPASQFASMKEVVVIDFGCGLGNDSLLNILERQQNREEGVQNQPPVLNVHFLDASAEAIQRLHSDPRYQHASESRAVVTSHLCSFASATSDLPHLRQSADIILLLFTLSAIGPYERHQPLNDRRYLGVRNAVKTAAAMLKPGAVILLRDYGRYDDDQLHLNSVVGAQLCDNFYVRGLDGSNSNISKGVGCYFFEQEEVRELFTDAGLEVMQLEYVTRVYKKSGRNGRDCGKNGGAVERRRVWINGRFRKPLNC
ncbi:hypothetical protein ACHAXT_005499 [Thalassiosira profunda]